MGLIAHYPLNGSLENKGIKGTDMMMISDVLVSNSGKIGKAYQFTLNNKKACLYANDIYPTDSTGNKAPKNNFSWCFWYNCFGDGEPGMYQVLMSIGTDFGSPSRTNIGIFIHLDASGRNLKVLYGNKGSEAKNIIYHVDRLNQWIHVCFSADSTHTYLYVDGKLVATDTLVDIASDLPLVLGKLGSIYDSMGDMTYSFTPNGCINDVRIYDHCLSKKEVHELYKCCILHYDFNDQYLEPTTNVITNQVYATGGGWAGHQVTLTKIPVEDLPIDYATHMVVTYSGTPTPGGGAYIDLSPYRMPVLPNTTYTMSIFCRSRMLLEGPAAINGLYRREFNSNNTNVFEVGFASKTRMEKLSNNWCRIYGTFTTTSTTATMSLHFYQYPHETCEYDVGGCQLEQKDHVTPFTYTSRADNTVYDSSGYGHDGILTPATSPVISTDTVLGKYSVNMTGATIAAPQIFFDNINQCHTINTWIKINDVPASSTSRVLLNFNVGYILACYWGTHQTLLYLNSGANDSYIYGEPIAPNKWLMLTWVVNTFDQTCKVYYHYKDGTKFKASSYNYTATDVPLGFSPTTVIKDLDGQMADFKIYASALSEEEIDNLYLSKASVDNIGNISVNHLYEQRQNLVPKTTWGFISEHIFTTETIPFIEGKIDQYTGNGIYHYNQSNCRVTWTDRGYRIYRPPNLTPSIDGNTMYGGLIWQPLVTDKDILVEGHSYIILWDVEGQSSNAIWPYFTNKEGWGGGGLQPIPTNISTRNLPPEFNGKMTCYYKFTISDSLYKVCTQSYSNFIQGNTYLSYRSFGFTYTYTDTGALGTDITITNLRMYDVTEETTAGISADSIFKGLNLLERNTINTAKVYRNKEIIAKEFKEI